MSAEPNPTSSSKPAHETTGESSSAASQESSVKETFVSLIISFVMALVFRSYVVEAFVIPTGSMAPTLRGAHIDFHSSQTGYEWAVNPWYMADGRDRPYPFQGQSYGRFIPQFGPPSATDPMTTTRLNPALQRQPGRSRNGFITRGEIKRLRAGDRILVQKYLYELFPPRRWDVVVFKNPEDSTQNFIKRLVGLPGEDLWLVDGDLFVRDAASGAEGQWRIARKPRRMQESIWRPVFSSEYAPLQPSLDGRTWFKCPWQGTDWETAARREYRFEGEGHTALRWNERDWPIWDWVPYNEWPGKLSQMSEANQFPVGDIRMRAGIEPDRAGLVARVFEKTRGHEFRATLSDAEVAIEMRRHAPGSSIGLEWTSLASAPWHGFDAGRVTNVEFWHADQGLVLLIDGRETLRAEYDWGADERFEYATGRDVEVYREAQRGVSSLAHASTYSAVRPEIRWEFEGSPLSLHRVGLDRDLYYEPASERMGGRASHPNATVSLGAMHFFVLGDNSPSSKDGRLWTGVDAPVREQIDETVGVVHRKLLLGKAFFVYFPAPHMLADRVPIPDFGRMRFIR